jgi:hypothetical protein
MYFAGMKAGELNQRDWLHEGYADACAKDDAASAVMVERTQDATNELDATPKVQDYHKSQKMVRDYRAALAALEVASAIRDARIAADRTPTTKEVRAEELARANFIGACRRAHAG